MTFELYPHQKAVLPKIRNGSVLTGGVGTGKSLTALAYYMKEEKHRDIYVITTAKKRDSLEWNGDAAKYGIGTKRDATVAGVLTVDSWNNITDYDDVKDAFFIFDEQRVVGSGAWVKSFIKIAKANRWILLSATPGDTWMDYIPLFVANGFYKNRTAFIRRHVVFSRFSKFPKVDHYVEENVLRRYRDRILVDMPFDRHTTRHIKYVNTEYDRDKFKQIQKKRWNIFEERPIRDVAEMFRVMRQLVNTDEDRIHTVVSLMEKHPRVIIFYNFNSELHLLRKMCDELEITYAEWNGHKHQPVPEGESWVYLVQYTSGNEGWNCITTDTVILYSLNYSYKVFEQSLGRIDRLNTPYKDLYYYVLVSKAPIDLAILKTVRAKKTFNEKAFGEFPDSSL